MSSIVALCTACYIYVLVVFDSFLSPFKRNEDEYIEEGIHTHLGAASYERNIVLKIHT